MRTRLKKANRNKGWQARHHAEIVKHLVKAQNEAERQRVQAVRDLISLKGNMKNEANRLLQDLISDHYFEKLLLQAAGAVTYADTQEIYKWMDANRAQCERLGIYNAETARDYFKKNAKGRRPHGQPFTLTIDDYPMGGSGGSVRRTQIRVSLPSQHMLFDLFERE